MALALLRIENFRNLAAAELFPLPRGLNVIYGNNGSGKTSLLEAIHYLGMGRSFRSHSVLRLIRHCSEKLSLFAQLRKENEQSISVGVERALDGSSRLRVDEQEMSSVAELAYALPIRLMNAQSHDLFESGPLFRRKYLDWGLFYQSQGFLSCWRDFERALKQRNAALRDHHQPKKELASWTELLIKHAIAFDAYRRAYIEALAPAVVEITSELIPLSGLKIRYIPGWNEGLSYAEALQKSTQEDLYYGCTQMGPHRADLAITINNIPAKQILSRGQQKLLICGMLLAQGAVLVGCTNKRLSYLVDDLPAELDLQSRRSLISLLSRQKTQVFVTTIEQAMIAEFAEAKQEIPMKVFHVEHGNIVEMMA